jgi:hypothetical protein
VGQPEDHLRLSLRIGMERIGVEDRPILEQSVQDVDRFPDPTGDEVAEQGYVGIGDVVVGDATVPAVADMASPNRLFSYSS